MKPSYKDVGRVVLWCPRKSYGARGTKGVLKLRDDKLKWYVVWDNGTTSTYKIQSKADMQDLDQEVKLPEACHTCKDRLYCAIRCKTPQDF